MHHYYFFQEFSKYGGVDQTRFLDDCHRQSFHRTISLDPLTSVVCFFDRQIFHANVMFLERVDVLHHLRQHHHLVRALTLPPYPANRLYQFVSLRILSSFAGPIYVPSSKVTPGFVLTSLRQGNGQQLAGETVGLLRAPCLML